ncbi:MAG TPA: hypothetical protein VF911_08640 [Thermoanaerobaculia bacterium]|jgi:hypothetical protein
MNVSRLILVFALALPLAADPLTDLRAALGRLTGRDPIRATYELQQSVVNEGKFSGDKFNGKVTLEVEGDANGFRVVFPRVMLDQINREQNAEAKDPKVTTPTLSAAQEFDPIRGAQALDFAPAILRLLEGAKLIGDSAGTWQGKQARVMVFRLADEPNDGPGKVTIAENKLTLWLGSDLVPAAAEQIFSAKMSFLILKGEARQKKSWHLSRVADRLVAYRHESSQVTSGLGQKGNETLVATVKVH